MKPSLLIKTRDLIQREKKPPFLKDLDLYNIEDGILIGVTGSLGCGYRVETQDLLLKDDLEIEDYEKRARKFLNSIPEGSGLHFIVRVRQGDALLLQEYYDSIQVEGILSQKFLESKIHAFMKDPVLRREIYLFVTMDPAGRSKRSSYLPDLSIAFGKKAHRLSRFGFEAARNALLRSSTEVEEGLSDLGFRLRPMPDEAVIQYCYELLNPCLSRDVYPFDADIFQKRHAYDSSSLRSKLLLSAAYSDYEFFYLDRHFHRSVNLLDLPESSNLKCIRDFEDGLGHDYLLSLSIEVPEQEHEKAGLKREGNFAHVKSVSSRTKDYEAEAKAGEADKLLTEIAETSDKLFNVALTVMVQSQTKEGAAKKSLEVLRCFRKLGNASGFEDDMNHDRLFLSFMPLQGRENPLTFLVRSTSLVHLLPLQASWPGTEKVGLLLRTPRNESLRFDLFDSRLQAKHAVMLGSTGSGKSFFTNHLLLHFLMESSDHHVIVIDLGGSYRKLAGLLDGAYLEVECSQEFALNPFPAREVLFPDNEGADSTFLQFLKELLQKMISPDRIWPSSEKMILERALHQTYERSSRVQAPLLGDVETSLRNFESGDEEDRKKAYQFAKELSLFTQGEYGKILNRPGRFDFDARFTVFDLRKISQYPELQEILLLIIPFALKRKFENVNLKKILVLDECWHLLKETQGTDLIELFYRTARKFNGAVLSISQNPEDFLEAKIASVMVNNSPVKYILRLKKGHEKLSSFGLNANEIKACEGLEVKPGRHSEVFIKFDDQGVIARLKPNPLEYWVATTDPTDLGEEVRLRSKLPTGSYLEILEKLAAQFPEGARKAAEETCHA